MRRFNAIAVPVLIATTLLVGACGSKGDRAYKACMAQVEAGIAELRREGAQAEAIAGPLLDMARTAGTASCEAIRDACRNEPDGIVCRSALEELEH